MSDLVIILAFIVVLLVPILLGIPIVYSIGISSLVLMLLPFGPSLSASVFPVRMLGASQAFILLAIPAYLLTGYLLNESGATEAVLDFSRELVGPLTAGLAQINIVASVLFSGMSGSATADAAGLGNVEFAMMTDAGYDDGISVAITGSSSIIGPIIPPSIPMIIYGSLAGVSVADLFIAGVIPGLLMAVALMITSYLIIRGRDYAAGDMWDPWALVRSFLRALPAFSVIVLIIGGIMTGVFTATEAGAVAVAWTMVVGFVFYRDLTLQSFWDASYRSMLDFGSLMIIFAITGVYSFMVVSTGIPSMLIDFLLGFSDSPMIVMFLIALGLLLLGMILDPIINIILVVPVLAPNFGVLGIDPLHTGVVMVLTLMIGLLTPPVGGILFILERVTDVPIQRISRAMVPYYVPLLIILVLIIVFPGLVTFLPEAVG